MNKTEIKQIILEEIEAALEEMNMSPEMMAADSRPEEDDFAFDKMDGEMYDDAGDPMEAVNEDLRGLMAQGEKMAAFANKQSGYEGGVSSPVRGVLAAMTVAGAPDFDGDEDLKAYWTRRLTKAIETQMGRKYMSGLNENIQQYIDREDDISDIRGKKAGKDYKTIRIDFNKPMFGDLKNAVGSYARKKYGDNIELDWRDSQEVEIDINRDLNEMARTSNIFKLSQNASLKDVLQFMQRVNDVLKTYKSPGQKRPKKRFTPEEMKALATAMLKPEGFTSKDVIAATSYTSPAQANKFLAALEQKGLITITSVLKKSLVPDRDPNAPETRGRKAQSAEFDVADDPTGMDFSDFDNLDLSDPTSLYELSEGKFGNVIQSLTQDISKAQDEGDDKMVSILKSYLPKLKRAQNDDEIESLLNDMDTQLAREFGESFDIVGSYLAEGSQLSKNNNNNNNNMSDNLTNYIKKVINEAKNPLAAKLKEVEAQGRIASLESKLAAIQEMIEETNSRLTRIDEDNEFSEMMDKKAVKDVRKQLKELERAEAKLQKEYDKVSGGRKKETVVDEDYDEDSLDNAVDEVELEEDDLRFEGLNGVHDLKPMVTMNESLLRMQNLAGLITEGEYKRKKQRLNRIKYSNPILEGIFDNVSNFVKGKSDKEAAAIEAFKKNGIVVGKPSYQLRYGGGSGEDGSNSFWMKDFATPEELEGLKVPVPKGFSGDRISRDVIDKVVIQDVEENEEGVVITVLKGEYNFKTGKFIDDDGPEKFPIEDTSSLEKELDTADAEDKFYSDIELVPYKGSPWVK